MSTYRSTRAADVQAASDMDSERTLTCAANGCPNRWSYRPDGSQGLCSAHAWADPRDWPRVTDGQQWHAAERARLRGEEQEQRQGESLTLADKRKRLEGMRAAILGMRVNVGRRDWATALQAREQAGDRLTPAQRAMWRAAVNPVFPPEAA